MIGFGGAHWSFVFNSEASLEEGEQIKETSPGHFVTADITKGYSPLDRYLMGFAPPADVPDTFVALNSSASPLGHPLTGINFAGTRLNISAGDVIQAMGRRTPDSTVAQRRYRFGFILVVSDGAADATLADSVQRVEGYRQAFVGAYGRFSANLAAADTTLNRAMKLSLFPAGGVVAAGKGSATISLQAPAAKDLAVRLSAPAGFAQVPAQVIVPAGATSTTFTITGGPIAGVEELLATPADPSYEAAFARVQVAAEGQLTLQEIVSNPLAGNVAVRLTDGNGLPYPGARIQAVATAGSVTPAVATANASGIASFQWLPDGLAVSQLKMSVEAAPGVTLAINAGRAVPVISGVVNAASFVAGVSPGSLATLFGANLGEATVLLNGADVKPFYASETQVNFYVPATAPIGENTLTVTAVNGLSVSRTFSLVAVQPGIFSGAVVHSGTLVSALTTPVRGGDFIEIYCTGLGPTRTSGGLSRTVTTPVVYFGSVAASPSFSGLAPGFVGLYQVNVQVPSGLAGGTVPLLVTSGNAYSNEVKITVQ
jgi:uncharacterized protein (TIGR03437 family)